MFSRFFIDRPIFASVLSILITLAGALAVFTLPLSQYPEVGLPTVQVDCNYPGASAQIISQTVAAPIEQQVNGVEGMLYMSSQCTSDGSYSLTVTFESGVDLSMAQVLVQNRLGLAMPSLPDVVRQTGVTTRKRSSDILMTVSVNSPDERYDQLYLSNYATLHLKDELARLPGVGEVRVFGERSYSIRVWIDSDRLTARDLAVTDVIAALREQNMQVALGQVGQPPAESGQNFQVPLSVLGRLTTPAEFGQVILRAGPDGRMVRIADVGRVELGARDEETSNRFNGKPTVGLAIFAHPDANALATGDAVKAKLAELSQEFPDGVVYEFAYDTTPFIRESVWEVVKTLFHAVILVALVVLVFLQGWRPAVIPLVAVPVAIVGTFAAMAAVGFSINNLTLFGLVLAIGIVVDDAIVVVEAVEQHLERGLSPRKAAIAAMNEVSGAVIAVGLVLSAVFVPCAFVPGVVGVFFRQFALTIAISTILSTFNSLTLSPALAALLLRPPNAKRDLFTRLLDGLLGWLFRAFDFGLRKSTSAYTHSVARLLRVPALVLVVYGGMLVLTYWGFGQLPTGFIPSQDKGYLTASVQLPDAASVERTEAAMAKIDRVTREVPGVKNVNSVSGNSFTVGARASNFGNMFIILDPFDERRGPGLSASQIAKKLGARLAAEIPEAVVNVFPPPAVARLGRAGGLKLMVQDRGDVGLRMLETETDRLIEAGNEQPQIAGLFTVYKANSPQLFADVDREACLAQGVRLADVFATLQAQLGSRYVNDFNRFGRTWQVIVQADAPYRDEIEDVKRLTVRNQAGQMVPLGSLTTIRPASEPLVLTRYNMYPAAAVNGNAAPGYSSGEAIAALEAVATQTLPPNMAAEWTELSFLERTSGNTGLLVFGFSVVFVFLVLAALYESWSLPLAVILVVPTCVLCSIVGVAVMQMDINIFTQIGFVVLIGLACKNAVLIVEYAKARREEGVDAVEATLAACRLRLRPILMTSFAFILGVVPLVIATGAGAEMRRALGTAVFSGMLGVTLFGIFLTPVFFFVIDRIAQRPIFHTGYWADASRTMLRAISFRSLRLRRHERRAANNGHLKPTAELAPHAQAPREHSPPLGEASLQEVPPEPADTR